MYITREQAASAITDMRDFYSSLKEVYASSGMNIEDDLGRRNILMSGPQEHFFAAKIRSNFPQTYNNGKTGEPDIVIPELSKHLECKLTTRHRSGALSFQSDSMTFEGHPDGVDFLYVIADDAFENFSVLHFEGLVRDDFHAESNGSRGKVRMKKHVAMSKCNVLLGEVIDRRDEFIDRYALEAADVTSSHSKRISELNERLKSEIPSKAKKTASTIVNELRRHDKKVSAIKKKIEMWMSKDPSYTIVLENIDGVNACQSSIYAV
jgi:hypothetical protein